MTTFANLFLPTWMLPVIPSILWPILLVLNFLMDSLVLYLWMKVKKVNDPLAVWKKSIAKIWLCGFAADFLACILLLLVSINADSLFGNLNIFIGIGGVLYGGFGCLFAAVLIWVFNRFFTLKKTSLSLSQIKSAAVFLAVFTAPYLLMLPTEWIYNW